MGCPRYGDDCGRGAAIVSVAGTIAEEAPRSSPFRWRLRKRRRDRPLSGDDYGRLASLPSLGWNGVALANRPLLSGIAVHHQMRNLALGILDELKAGRCCCGLEFRFRFHQ